MALFHKKTVDPVEKLDRPVLDDTGIPDIPYLVLTILLTATGNSAYYFVRQAIFAVVGVGVVLVVGRRNYFIWYRLAFPIFGAAVLLLVMVLVPRVGVTHNGATRWIKIGVEFQPSEVAKLGVILTFGAMMSVWQDKMKTFTYGVLPYALIMGIVAVLLYFEPHLSATLIIFMVGATMMLIGGTRKFWFVLGGAAVLVFLTFYLSKQGYAGGRFTAWRNPENDARDSGYQIIQSRYAIGSGGFLGLGFGKSRQKYLYLPEEHNDYIFAIVCEELGYVGAVGIILLFVMLILRGYWIALHARDRFGTLVAAGLTTKLAIQVFFNIGVVSNFLPATGISLPFFSYGGTALLLQMFEMGLVLSISRWCVNKEAWRRRKTA